MNWFVQKSCRRRRRRRRCKKPPKMPSNQKPLPFQSVQFFNSCKLYRKMDTKPNINLVLLMLLLLFDTFDNICGKCNTRTILYPKRKLCYCCCTINLSELENDLRPVLEVRKPIGNWFHLLMMCTILGRCNLILGLEGTRTISIEIGKSQFSSGFRWLWFASKLV